MDSATLAISMPAGAARATDTPAGRSGSGGTQRLVSLRPRRSHDVEVRFRMPAR